MSIFERIYLGEAEGDGLGTPARSCFDKINNMMDYLEDMFARSKTMNGFDQEDKDTLGIIQYCHESSSGEVHQIDENGDYTKLTGQTQFADASTSLADRTLAQYHSSGQSDFKYWYQGTKHEVDTLKTIQLPDDSDGHFVVYESDGTMALSSSTWQAIVDDVLVSLVAQNAVTGVLNYYADERHGLVMDGQTHLHAHLAKKNGFLWVDGFDITGLADNGTTFTSIASGLSGDEDVHCDVDAITQVPILYRLGANGEFTFSSDSNNLGLFDAGKCVYNKWDGSVWSLSEINYDYVNMTLFTSNNKLHPHFFVLGQYLHANRGAARDHLMANVTELQLDGIISPEVYPMYSMIIHNESNGQIEKGSEGEIYIDHRWGYPVMRF